MITIRPLELKDADALVALGARAVEESRYRAQPYDPEKIRLQIDRYFSDQRRKYIWLVGIRNNELLGSLFGGIEEYWFTKERGANMIVWYVAKEARGSAIAIKLLLAFRGWAQNRHATELTLSITSAVNTEKTGRFLRRMGFRPCGENFYQTLGPAAIQAGKINLPPGD